MYPTDEFDPLTMRAPHILGDLPGWCFHRSNDGRRPMFFYADGGWWPPATSVDRARLTQFGDSFDWYFERGMNGLAFVLIPEFRVVAIELPDCFDREGNLAADVRRVVAEALYAERMTIEGLDGVRLFLRWPESNPAWQPALRRVAKRSRPRFYRAWEPVEFSGLCLPSLKSQREALNGR